MARVPFADLEHEFHRVLAGLGLPGERAVEVARIFAEAQRDGVTSHGMNRFAGFVADIRERRLDPFATPERVGGFGAMEQWDGKLGLGPWNAHVAMGRAITLAREHGLGGVGLRNTNHWMRAGAYGLQAADAGCVGICWTNTLPLMPPWGSAEVRIGNNPLVVAIPRREGHLLLDMALSQFSRGRMEVLEREGRSLPVTGGYDTAGNLTRDPGAVLASRRLLPVGFWKGSALAVILDAAAAILSGGRATHEIGRDGRESAVSQVFLAIELGALAGDRSADEVLAALVRDLSSAAPLGDAAGPRYPGEGMARTRRESLAQGVWVDEGQFAALRAMGP